jgi:photosynthetic reaction center H subunit
MDPGRENAPPANGWPSVESKTYLMADGSALLNPDPNRIDGTYYGKPIHGWIGAPLEPVGDPLLAGVGPGAWAARADHPDMTFEGEVKIVPLRVAQDHGVALQDTEPRGLSVFGADREVAGIVKDLWVDRSEMLFRYIEIELPNGHSVLMPMNFARIKKTGVYVHALLAHQFANVPGVRTPNQITFLEEEKIMAYFGAGLLYATPERQEPLV